jgi:hypothetical protein
MADAVVSKRAFRANGKTLPAVDAKIPEKPDLYVRRQAFGIGAPTAAQRAAFQKYHRPDARPIVD